MRTIMHTIYEIIYAVYIIFVTPFYLAKRKVKAGFMERFGSMPDDLKARIQGKEIFWVHAVSVGEVMIAQQFIKKLRSRIPGVVILLTTTTASGREVAKRSLAKEDELLYFPLDFRFSVRRFLDAINPKAAVFMETELWPNMIGELNKRGIPIFIANARISDKAIHQYRMVSSFLKHTLSGITMCFAQSDSNRDRFIEIGINAESVETMGNMKFDLEPKPGLETEAIRRIFDSLRLSEGSKVLLAASTHAKEEEIILDAVINVKIKIPQLKLVLAPRHIERAGSIERMIKQRGMSSDRLSGLIERQSAGFGEIVIVDKWGVLTDLYDVADMIFVGGSLVKHGGHNIAEAAFSNRPIIHGPHMHNFAEMTDEFRSKRAAIEVNNQRELEDSVLRLFVNGKAREDMAFRAREVLAKNQGVIQNTIEKIICSINSRCGESGQEILGR